MSPKEWNRAKGANSERLGEAYLEEQGYQILERNVRSPFGEIDLVCRDRNTLVFVEVKSRTDEAFGFPEEAVDRRKRERLGRLAAWYLARYSTRSPEVRFDVLAIQSEGDHSGVRLIRNAFEL